MELLLLFSVVYYCYVCSGIIIVLVVGNVGYIVVVETVVCIIGLVPNVFF